MIPRGGAAVRSEKISDAVGSPIIHHDFQDDYEFVILHSNDGSKPLKTHQMPSWRGFSGLFFAVFYIVPRGQGWYAYGWAIGRNRIWQKPTS